MDTGRGLFLIGIRIYAVKAEKHQVIPIFCCLFIKEPAGICLHIVITVYKPDIFAVRMGKAVIPGAAYAMIVCGIDKKLIWVQRLISLQDLQASICTAVIYSNDLYVFKGLGKQAVQAEA